MLKVNGMVVCVNYSDFLALGISRWYNYLNTLTVVTDMRDLHTAELIARYPGVKVHATDIFYANGAKFNKGAAMEEARLGPNGPEWSDWMLFFDADVVPELDWFRKLEQMPLLESCLYGARRYQVPEHMRAVHDISYSNLPLINDGPCDGGYFHLFHSSKLTNREMPLLETCWSHAGVYDSHFRMSWHPTNQHVLPINLYHFGARENWCGRGNDREMRDLLDQRRIKGGYLHERLPGM